mmetsp:Transcript_12803/g.32799  ORF Transcript_12803/g.32799 Transcript_12803/m.32799 type:complete len:197 (-) Transcript_12803:342-932(-)|eukprot:CAMPEP_0182926736 /NCGR_PEP_ID=MMETSP0105_2-20130417/12238_1 /TAXON_ID=81532 ORGANISM="Acanthoeca-like sp., Strain 10tr" /NCGR_SAMPLE_ID=MMETSP0105_2 /ASSEMBLY_ACC=CAM_ASM_000205 /LENGTH=196 /DNA_ID=CAMNT_0025064645 /DNA_START=47 /DNA_END=637 /DNA_ORIENTATION=-
MRAAIVTVVLAAISEVAADQCGTDAYQTSTNLQGSLVVALSGTTYTYADACCKACLARAECTAWSHQSSTARCYLKKNVVAVLAATDVWTSGGAVFHEGSTAPKEPDQEVGLIVMLAGACTMLVYLTVGGVVRKVQGHTGRDLVPHREFWGELPGLVSAGAEYTALSTMAVGRQCTPWRGRNVDAYEALTDSADVV